MLRSRESEAEGHGADSRRRSNLLLGLVLVAALAIGLVAGLAVGRGTADTPEAAPGLAGDDVLTMLEDRVETLNTGTAEELAAFYSRDAVLEERDVQPARVTRGAEQIAAHLIAYRDMGWRLYSETTAVRLGRYVAEGMTWAGGGGGIVVYELDEHGKIAHAWVVGGTP